MASRVEVTTRPSSHLTRLPSAHLTRVRPSSSATSGKINLYSKVPGAVMRIDTHSKKLKDTCVEARCQEAWKRANAFIRARVPGASRVRIVASPNQDSSSLDRVSLTYLDSAGVERHVSHRDVPTEVIKKMDAVRKMVWPSRPSVSTAPLTMMPGVIPKTHAEFMNSHFAAMIHNLEPAKKHSARRIVNTCDEMIVDLETRINNLMNAKEADLNANIPLLPHPVRRQKEKELKQLRQLHAQIRSIDRYAVYWAIASWGNLATGDITDAVRAQIRAEADKISIGIGDDLRRLETDRSNAGQNKLFKSRSKYLIHKYEPSEPYRRGHSLDTGDLIIADRWDRKVRSDESDNSDKRSSVEELVVSQMMNLLIPTKTVDPTHPLVAQFDDPDTQTAVMQAVELSKAAARP